LLAEAHISTKIIIINQSTAKQNALLFSTMVTHCNLNGSNNSNVI